MSQQVQSNKHGETMVNLSQSIPSTEVINDEKAISKNLSISARDVQHNQMCNDKQESSKVQTSMYYPVICYSGYYCHGYDDLYAVWQEPCNYLGHDGWGIQYCVTQPANGSVPYYTTGSFDYNLFTPYLHDTMFSVDGPFQCQQPWQSPAAFLEFPSSMNQYPLYPPDIYPFYQWISQPIYNNDAHDPAFLSMYEHAPSVFPASYNSSFSPRKSKSLVSVCPPPSHGLQPAHVNMQSQTKFAASNLSQNSCLSSCSKRRDVHLLHSGLSKIGRLGCPGVDKSRVASTITECCDYLPDEKILDDLRAKCPKREQYNLESFPIAYKHASFYVIKSYSKDDVHKSIKYNVWSSTPNGNKKLDEAYQVAEKAMQEKGCTCPVFLFFSVNASGQFCGVAEMNSRVDFEKNMTFWQQDKWHGFFTVKWHIIKDVPNLQFRHILLENNENKPVTYSKDTQEVTFLAGLQMLKIFKNVSAMTSILDDFEFYEIRQQAIQNMKPSRWGASGPSEICEPVKKLDCFEI